LKKLTILTVLVVTVLALAVTPTFAQQITEPNTITVIGVGSASGAPDIANLEVGVETIDPDLATAYNTTNTRIDEIITALVDGGVAREDVRTIGLNVWQDRFGGPNPAAFTETGEAVPVYVVSNNIRLTIRDIDNVPNVLNIAIEAGATNIFGLNFAIDDADALASEARADALDDARAKAGELANLAEVELGEIVTIVEAEGGFDPFNQFATMEMGRGGGGGGAAIEPGQLSVNVRLQVTFRINS
jgi:uncharacterized protein YggE